MGLGSPDPHPRGADHPWLFSSVGSLAMALIRKISSIVFPELAKSPYHHHHPALCPLSPTGWLYCNSAPAKHSLGPPTSVFSPGIWDTSCTSVCPSTGLDRPPLRQLLSPPLLFFLLLCQPSRVAWGQSASKKQTNDRLPKETCSWDVCIKQDLSNSPMSLEKDLSF